MTHDLDFSDTRKFEPGRHAGVLIVRLPDSAQWRVGDHLVGWFSDPDARTWERWVVATLRKVRVVRGATANAKGAQTKTAEPTLSPLRVSGPLVARAGFEPTTFGL